ncbi:hypothetical protein RHMOL_Rhmol04G0196300 [Rhododendron molle]|uniref:Uncharacterized protein n=1 Tax=Rhododendron molle TaxID=49168 RepID=A0ACC0P3D9_RHOML|nr:hypothetical protein RHMOL_Rhmol04G0196300 [Rhododendron molle]
MSASEFDLKACQARILVSCNGSLSMFSVGRLQLSSPSILQEATPLTSPTSVSSSFETSVMADQPLALEAMLMNLQNSITTKQQKAAQTDTNITHLNDLINTRLPQAPEEEGDDDEDVHEQPIMIEDPNHAGRLIVLPNPGKARAPATNPNPAGVTSGSNASSSNATNHIADVNQVQTPQNNRPRTQTCSFSTFEEPLSSVMEKLIKSGHLKPP